MKILLVEDHEFTAKSIQYSLCGKHTVVHAPTYVEAQTHLEESRFDTILLDLSLPDGKGIDFCKEFAEESTTALIIISGSTDTSTKVHALEAGADDYITKPFTTTELAARIKAVTRRVFYKSHTKPVTFRHLMLQGKLLQLNDKSLQLTAKEANLLQHFLRFPRQTLHRSQLQPRGERANLLETHIKNLRQKLKQLTTKHQIKTIYGEGYQLTFSDV